jgi:deoxyribodipyrimidine photo-lyase
MNKSTPIALHWFRRDLRLEDNLSLNAALSTDLPVLCIFIFDEVILSKLPKDDARVSFIHQQLTKIDKTLRLKGASLLVLSGLPKNNWEKLVSEYNIHQVFYAKDYEPYAKERDAEISAFLKSKNIIVTPIKDQVVFEETEVTKSDGLPYTIYTPYKNKWLERFKTINTKPKPLENGLFLEGHKTMLTLADIGFEESEIRVKEFNFDDVTDYQELRNFPAKDATTYLSPHLRFGTISTRQVIAKTKDQSDVFLSELIWREFFMQILFHFPNVVKESFSPKYRQINWRNNKAEFERWCKGQTGYPLVDAGMRQLNQTGYMHNRVRMVVASFLCKHLLIDWRWGEAYFAQKLLDFDLSANNGNWQWAAGTGCDAAPYFRVFNPTEQVKKFDPKMTYIRKWVPEINQLNYPQPMVEHTFARNRAIETYKNSILTL